MNSTACPNFAVPPSTLRSHLFMYEFLHSPLLWFVIGQMPSTHRVIRLAFFAPVGQRRGKKTDKGLVS